MASKLCGDQELTRWICDDLLPAPRHIMTKEMQFSRAVVDANNRLRMIEQTAIKGMDLTTMTKWERFAHVIRYMDENFPGEVRLPRKPRKIIA